MKAIKISAILFSAILVLGLTSCNSCSDKKQDNTHTHDDGSVHSDHAPEAATPAGQENFKVEADSTQKAAPATEEKGCDNDHANCDSKHL